MAATIDTFELARTGEALSGRYAVARLERLASLLAAPDGQIDWQLRGWRRPRAEGGFDDFMELALVAAVRPVCVRCLLPVQTELRGVRRYRLVRSEDEAQRLDPDDDEYDVIAGSARFDLEMLVEDEAIMALPQAPTHDACAPAGSGQADDASAAPEENPFAAWARLRGRGPPNGGERGD